MSHDLDQLSSKIIMDSCTELDLSQLDPQISFARVPFTIIIDNHEIIDVNLNCLALIDQMQMSRGKITTACPSPQAFYNSFDPERMNYVVTISSHLSGCYNSAQIAKKMAEESGFGDRVYVFDSLSAVSGEDMAVLKLIELIKRRLPVCDLIPIERDYIANMTTMFVLNSMDNLVRNGRVRPAVAIVGKMLRIVPIMQGVSGVIDLKEKCRGRRKSLLRLAQIISGEVKNPAMRKLIIAHVSAPEKALTIRDAIVANGTPFKDIIILEAGGLGTVYADNGGIVVAY